MKKEQTLRVESVIRCWKLKENFARLREEVRKEWEAETRGRRLDRRRRRSEEVQGSKKGWRNRAGMVREM